MSHPFFTHELTDSWHGQNVMHRCVRVCGVVKREAEQNVKVELK